MIFFVRATPTLGSPLSLFPAVYVRFFREANVPDMNELPSSAFEIYLAVRNRGTAGFFEGGSGISSVLFARGVFLVPRNLGIAGFLGAGAGSVDCVVGFVLALVDCVNLVKRLVDEMGFGLGLDLGLGVAVLTLMAIAFVSSSVGSKVISS